jgi:diguanylate cyclase (GGDEF)-like protein
MAKDFPKDFIVVSLSNLINAKAQFCSSNEIEAMLKELEEMLKDVNIEYFLYIGYRRLALVNIYYHRSEEIRRFIPYLRNIKSIPENNVLIKIFEGYLGEDIDLLSLEEDVLETKEIQIILIYLRLLLEKGLTPRKITKEFYSEFPLYQFMKGLIEKEDPISLLKYIDSMLERWEYLDALSSYLLLIKTAGLQDHSSLQHLSYFEAMSLSYLLNLNSIAEKLRKEIPLNGFPVDEYARVRIIEYYFKEALINSENEEQAIRLIHMVLSEYLDDFLIRVNVASRTIEKGDTLFGTGNEKLRYENSPFSITLYSREEPNSLTLSLLRSFLNAFIIFWERRYGMYDALTGLLNRTYGIKRIEELFNEYKRNKEPFSIVFIDVDSLKKINDTMGHSYGDLVLQEIASSIKSTIRQTDYAIRWGGDEFLILLRNTDYDNAEKVIKKIDDRISASSNGRFSVSYGVEAVSEYTTTYDKLIETADIKMYANKYSKRRGGNISES